jgi:hypothetical protein
MEGFETIAVAGAWGYIGRKVLDAAMALGSKVWALDPGPVPADLDLSRVAVMADEAAFYGLDANLFHLALHPQHRGTAFARLLPRAATGPMLILCEKPMAEPERPADCSAAIAASEARRAVVLYDFVELFDPLTHAILRFLSGFDRVELTEIHLLRSKDREDPARSRNYKTMVHIQYQESVHCLAFLLNLTGHLAGDLETVFARGLTVAAQAQPYAPPNPSAYPYVVDGRCDYRIDLGELRVEGCTNFKTGAEFTKRKVIRGLGDGRPFVIEADHFEGRKYLRIDGVDQGFPADSSSYTSILTTLGEWDRTVDHDALRRGVYPNPRFTRLTYQLSSVLWRSGQDRGPISLDSMDELVAFGAGFAETASRFPRYPD